jgi:hypothetical protein
VHRHANLSEDISSAAWIMTFYDDNSNNFIGGYEWRRFSSQFSHTLSILLFLLLSQRHSLSPHHSSCFFHARAYIQLQSEPCSARHFDCNKSLCWMRSGQQIIAVTVPLIKKALDQRRLPPGKRQPADGSPPQHPQRRVTLSMITDKLLINGDGAPPPPSARVLTTAPHPANLSV